MTSASVDPMTSMAVPPGMPSPQPAMTIFAPAADLLSLPWRLVSVNGERLTILFVAGDDSCVFPVGVHVDETDTQVEISALSKDNGHGSCADRLTREIAYVELHQPLSNRSLMHAPVDKTWANTRP